MELFFLVGTPNLSFLLLAVLAGASAAGLSSQMFPIAVPNLPIHGPLLQGRSNTLKHNPFLTSWDGSRWLGFVRPSNPSSEIWRWCFRFQENKSLSGDESNPMFCFIPRNQQDMQVWDVRLPKFVVWFESLAIWPIWVEKPCDFHQANVEPPTKKARPEVPKSPAHSKIFQCTVRAVMFRDVWNFSESCSSQSDYWSFCSKKSRLRQQFPTKLAITGGSFSTEGATEEPRL